MSVLVLVAISREVERELALQPKLCLPTLVSSHVPGGSVDGLRASAGALATGPGHGAYSLSHSWRASRVTGQLADLARTIEEMADQLKALQERSVSQQRLADSQQER